MTDMMLVLSNQLIIMEALFAQVDRTETTTANEMLASTMKTNIEATRSRIAELENELEETP